MLIYKTKEELKPESSDYISELINNELDLGQKMDLLVSNYQKLKLDPTGFRLLIEALCDKLGLETHFPRKGDVNERFDVLISNTGDNYQIVSEVEIPSTAILDAPRNLLDDMAVLVSRRGTNASDLIPLVICWDFPNKRTDYWNVVQDIKHILDIKIKTCSVLSLAVLAWTENAFDARSDTYFLHTNENALQSVLEILKAHEIDTNVYNGFFSPVK